MLASPRCPSGPLLWITKSTRYAGLLAERREEEALRLHRDVTGHGRQESRDALKSLSAVSIEEADDRAARADGP